jgi:hypothetical protein
MAVQKCCDGCGLIVPTKDASGVWARIYVPSNNWITSFGSSIDDDKPQYDLCPDCLNRVASLLTVFPSSTTRLEHER